MKRSLTILLAILSLSIFFNIERDQEVVLGSSEVKQLSLEDREQSFSQGDSFIDLAGCRGASSSISAVKLVTKTLASRRTNFDTLSGVKIAIADLYSECSYSYSCDFPFEHQPQKELFFILRNIRI